MGKYESSMKGMIAQGMEVQNATNNFLKYIANELAEGNRLKIIELLQVFAHDEGGTFTPVKDTLEDQA